ncbi:hypothetical protein JTE90_020029 [Oedothorax gibbosus]|uniref:Uncharacterized protein n=1 Tax=Oedothorax gibbosus TaxID=931172 RepID=A0AAV6UUE5_9ARAC|nr:hypothetical protein JTE90_020029 [Oedothorax gibbosus]
MNYLSFLFVITAGLFTFRVAWMIYEYDPEKSPTYCSCSCSDATMTTADLSARVEYKGFKGNGTCTCRDFLVPRIGQYAMAVSANETCQLCKCGPVQQDEDCQDGYMTFSAMFSVVTYTVAAMTCLLMFSVCVNSCCFPKKKSRRSGYHRISVENGNRIFDLNPDRIRFKDRLELAKELSKTEFEVGENALVADQYRKYYQTFQQ